MKRMLLLIFAALLVMNANAQLRTSMAVFGGLSLSQQVDHYEGPSYVNDVKPGFHAGALLNFPLSCHLSLQPGLLYNAKGGQQAYTRYTAVGDANIRTEYKDRLTLSYVELPLLLVYRCRMNRTGGWQVGAGFYGAYCAEAHTTHRIKYDGGAAYGLMDSKTTNVLDIGNDTTNQILPWDFGTTGMISYQFRHGFFMRATVDIGLVNIIAGDNINGLRETEPHTPKSDPNLKNMSYMFSVGWFFR